MFRKIVLLVGFISMTLGQLAPANADMNFMSIAARPPDEYLVRALEMAGITPNTSDRFVFHMQVEQVARSLLDRDGQPQGDIAPVVRAQLWELERICGATTAATRGKIRTGCTLSPDDLENPNRGYYTPVVASDVNGPYRVSVVIHELGHIGGWPDNHSMVVATVSVHQPFFYAANDNATTSAAA